MNFDLGEARRMFADTLERLLTERHPIARPGRIARCIAPGGA